MRNGANKINEVGKVAKIEMRAFDSTCEGCKAGIDIWERYTFVGAIEINYDEREHGKEETVIFCPPHFVSEDEAGRIPSGVGIVMDHKTEMMMDGYFG